LCCMSMLPRLAPACLQRVHKALESGGEMPEERSWAGPSEEDPTYRLLVDCNQLAVDIDNEIAIVHVFMRDKYKCVLCP
jgi:U4/U6 small nuclear ribonucleoprotein PRP31